MRPAPVKTTKWNSALPWLIVLVIWWVWTLTPFYGVNVTTNDQVKWAMQANQSGYAAAVGAAKAQGRIYMLATKAGLLLGSLAPDRPVSKWLLLITFALTPLCFAYLMYPTPGPRLLFVWVYAGLVWAGWNHLPPAAWASLAYLPFLFWAATAWIVRNQIKPGGNESVALLFFALAVFCAYFQYESITTLSMVGFGWLLLSTPLPETTRRKFWWTLAGTTLFYLACYVSWRAYYGGGYSGNTVASFSLFEIVQVIVAYTRGGLPFSEHFFASKWHGSGSFSGNIIEAVFRAGAFSIALYIAAAVAVCALYSLTEDDRNNDSVNRRGTRVAYHQSGWFWWAMILAMLLAINGPLGLSSHQNRVSDWDHTYFTSGIALLPMCLGVVWLLERCYRGVLFERVRPMFLLLVALIAIGGTVVRAHNEQVTSRQHWNVSQWEALRVISFGNQIWGPGPFVAPDFFFAHVTGLEKIDWSEHWARYSKARFGVHIQFLDDFPPVAERRPARIELHHLDNGHLRALTVQTGSKLFVIAKPQDRPRRLLSENKRKKLRWGHAQKIPGTDYQYLEYDGPDKVTNPFKWVDLAWFEMDGKYVRPKNQPYVYGIP
ncbi:hypothetical protein N9H39_01875 [Gammaproteobacteria bacterium]|nr:hypothetical protein [Gammaproteobacteria bacterium]